MFIDQPRQVTDELLDAFARVLPQLKINLPRLNADRVAALLSSDSVSLLAARSDGLALSGAAVPSRAVEGLIVGLLTLIVYPTPSGVRARIEDVVVDESARGRGVASALIQSALEMAKQKGADGVALTSNPRRESANRLYQKLGFTRWETNVYFFKFGE